VLSVTVLYFAALRDLAGVGEEKLEVASSGSELSVRNLLLELEQRHGSLQGRLDSVRVAVNEEFTERGALLRGGEVVALIPPVSGG
jgi:molybdopterin synthase sulfur carrier subunit